MVTVNEMATVINVTGNASVEHYINLLSQVTFVSTAGEPGNTSRTVVFELVDDRGFSVSAQCVVTIVPTNDPAVFNFNGSVVTFDERTGTPVNLFQSSDSLSDPDGDSLLWTTLEIRPSIDEMDVLSVDLGTSGLVYELSTNTDNNTVLNITGYANFSVYESVLRTITFSNPSPGLSQSSRTIHVVTFDGKTESPPTLITIFIDGFDDSPVCYFDSMVGVSVSLHLF